MDEYEIETFEHAGFRVRILADMDGQHADPRDNAGNVGVMLAPHRDYTLGDAGDSRSHEYDVALRAMEHFDRAEHFVRWAKIFLGATAVLPLRLLDHSGLSMTVGRGAHPQDPGGWDSGQIGWIFDTPATREETGVEVERVEENLREEVKAYSAYLEGSVVGWTVEEEVTWTATTSAGDTLERDEWDVRESCWGYLIVDHERDMEYVRSEARDTAESLAAARVKA